MRDYDSHNQSLHHQASISEGGMPRRASWLLAAMALMVITEVLRYFIAY